MPCSRIVLPDGTVALVRHAAPRKVKCSACGKPRSAVRLCDWKVDGGTCDARLCLNCTSVPDIDPTKDLCPTHAKMWAARKLTQGHPL